MIADQLVFDVALSNAISARHYRAYAKAMRGGTSIYGWTIANAEHEARLYESTVRRLADQTIAQAAKATGAAK